FGRPCGSAHTGPLRSLGAGSRPTFPVDALLLLLAHYSTVFRDSSMTCTGSVDAKDFPPSFGVSFVCGLPAGHVFVRSQVAESLVGPDVIVGLFPVTEEDVVGVQ